MIVLNLNCKNFRNLENINISPCEEMNVICGENAQGKTNILEGIWLFSSCKSFRGSDDKDFINTEKELYTLLSSHHEREIGAGSTLWGIHRDDIEVELNGHEARLFCSQGQQRSLALALKLAEGEICREDCGEYPVFLLDDVLSELDGKRRHYLLEKMKGKQVIMTGCEQMEYFSGKLFYVENGTVREGLFKM